MTFFFAYILFRESKNKGKIEMLCYRKRKVGKRLEKNV